MRCTSAAVAGVIIARRAPEAAADGGTFDPVGEEPSADGEPTAARPPAPSTARTVTCAAVATAAAVGASWLGVRWRGWAADRTGHDYIGAGLEDALAVGLAGLSVRV